MAIVTYTIASLADGLVRGEIDLDDKTLRVRVARVINDSDYPAYIEVFKAGTSMTSQIVAPHDTISKNIPAAMGINFTMDEGDPVWGYPPKMTMGDIEIHMRWG